MKLGIIGGSGLYEMTDLQNIATHEVSTPFGRPSDKFISGTLNGHGIVFLPRHGVGHRLLPHEINHKANICGFKMLGVTHIIGIAAVGSLREEIKPRDVVIPDQYFDRTKQDASTQTFFGEGVGAHISFGRPVCPELTALAAQAAGKAIADSDQPQRRVHDSGTYVNMAGPAFSTKAESEFYRAMHFDVVGMTNLFEAKLAREAEICYATIAMVTDYDCWHPDHDHVTVDMVREHMHANTQLGHAIVRGVVTHLEQLQQKCSCPNALAGALITAPDAMPEETKRKLQPIIGRYWA